MDNEDVEPLDKGIASRDKAICQLLKKTIDVIGHINREAKKNVKEGGGV